MLGYTQIPDPATRLSNLAFVYLSTTNLCPESGQWFTVLTDSHGDSAGYNQIPVHETTKYLCSHIVCLFYSIRIKRIHKIDALVFCLEGFW